MSGLKNKEGNHGGVTKGGFFRRPGVNCTSSSPWVSVNYFSPLTIEEGTEPKTMSDPPPESERSEKRGEDRTVKKEVDRSQKREWQSGCCGWCTKIREKGRRHWNSGCIEGGSQKPCNKLCEQF